MCSVCIFPHSTKTQNMHTHRHTHTLTHSVTHRHTHSPTKFCYLDTCRSGAHGQWAALGGPPSASAWLSECHLWPGTEGGGRTPRWTHSPSQPHSMQNPGSFALQAERERKASYAQLFHRPEIGRWLSYFQLPSHQLAALSVESRSLPAVVSTSRLLLIFNLWAAECTGCFLYFM